MSLFLEKYSFSLVLPQFPESGGMLHPVASSIHPAASGTSVGQARH